MYRERVGYDESQEIKEPWYTNTGVQKRLQKWESLKPETKYEAPWYTRQYWKNWGNILRENIDNEYEREGKPLPQV